MGFDFTRLFRWLISKKEQKESAMPAAKDTQRADSRAERVNFSSGSRRDQDMSAEAELARFIDENLYTRFPNSSSFKTIARVHDKEQQLQGVDVVFTAVDDRKFRVDEKAQLYYLNKDLPTFAFEINFLRDGWPTTGWLCNETLKTDLYLLIWPFADQDDCKGISANQFTKVDCLLIQKKAILNFLEKNGLSIEQMVHDAKKIREEGKTGKIPIEGVRGIYYYASDPRRYREAPINVVISKKYLLGLKQRRYIVTREQVEVE